MEQWNIENVNLFVKYYKLLLEIAKNRYLLYLFVQTYVFFINLNSLPVEFMTCTQMYWEREKLKFVTATFVLFKFILKQVLFFLFKHHIFRDNFPHLIRY